MEPVMNDIAPAPATPRKKRIGLIVAGIVIVLLALAYVGASVLLANAGKDSPLHMAQSFWSVALLPEELRAAQFVSIPERQARLHTVTGTGYKVIAGGISGIVRNGTHDAATSGGFGQSSFYVDTNKLFNATTSLLVTPAISRDGTTVAWGDIPTPHKPEAFSKEKVVVRNLATGQESSYPGVAPFFTKDGELGRITDAGVVLLNLETAKVRTIAAPADMVFSATDIFLPSFTTSPDGDYIGWTTKDGNMVVMRIGEASLEPVLSEKSSAQYLALSETAAYVIEMRNSGDTDGKQFSFAGKEQKTFYVPSFLKFNYLRI